MRIRFGRGRSDGESDGSLDEARRANQQHSRLSSRTGAFKSPARRRASNSRTPNPSSSYSVWRQYDDDDDDDVRVGDENALPRSDSGPFDWASAYSTLTCRATKGRHSCRTSEIALFANHQLGRVLIISVFACAVRRHIVGTQHPGVLTGGARGSGKRVIRPTVPRRSQQVERQALRVVLTCLMRMKS
jgi:hypothetical protein